MKYISIIILLTINLILVSSDCGTSNYVNDPEPWGGLNCTNDLQCNAPSGGFCSQNVCICYGSRGKPDCSYQRISAGLPGGLNIGLVFIGIGGVGNFIIGRIGAGVGQIILTTSMYLLCIFACIFTCIFACCENENLIIFRYIVGGILSALFIGALIAGFIWSIVDGAFILQCKYTDPNGYALYL